MNIYKITFEDLDNWRFSSVTDLCRQMIKDNIHHQYDGIEVYRGEMKCLIVNNIEEAAKLTVRENSKEGPKFIKYRPLSEKDKETLCLKSI